MAYFTSEKMNLKIYAEFKAGYERLKNKQIDELLENEDVKYLDEVIERVADIYEACEDGKRLFHDYIFYGTIPEDMLPDDDEEDEEELEEKSDKSEEKKED